MKKPIKNTLIVLAVLTVITEAAAAVMLNIVSGDALFYMNPVIGRIIAVSFRWVCLAGAALLLFWILLAFRKRKSFFAKRPKEKPADKAEPEPDADSQSDKTEPSGAPESTDGREETPEPAGAPESAGSREETPELAADEGISPDGMEY